MNAPRGTRGLRAAAWTLRVGVWGFLSIVAWYTIVEIPPVAGALLARQLNPSVPGVLMLAGWTALVGAVWHAALNPAFAVRRRILAILLIVPTTIFGAMLYHFMFARRTRRVGAGGTQPEISAPAV